MSSDHPFSPDRPTAPGPVAATPPAPAAPTPPAPTPEAPTQSAPASAAPVAPAADEVEVEVDEMAVLDQLEADLSAVEQAITTLDAISSDGVGGEQAAAQISAAVSADRFGGASTV